MFVIATMVATVASVHAGTLIIDEDWSSNFQAAQWGSNWSLGAQVVSPSFLPGGGSNAGRWSAQGAGNNNVGQDFSRSFRNSTVVSETDQYFIQFGVTLAQGDDPSRGEFLFIDGSNAGKAAQVGFSTSRYSSFNFRALNAGTGTVEMLDSGGNPLAAIWGGIYVFDIAVNPTTRTYDASVTQLNAQGAVIAKVSVTGLNGEATAYNNNAHGNLFFFNTTQNNRNTTLDRIIVSNSPIDPVPEPSVIGLVGLSAAFALWGRRRRR